MQDQKEYIYSLEKGNQRVENRTAGDKQSVGPDYLTFKEKVTQQLDKQKDDMRFFYLNQKDIFNKINSIIAQLEDSKTNETSKLRDIA